MMGWFQKRRKTWHEQNIDAGFELVNENTYSRVSDSERRALREAADLLRSSVPGAWEYAKIHAEPDASCGKGWFGPVHYPNDGTTEEDRSKEMDLAEPTDGWQARAMAEFVVAEMERLKADDGHGDSAGSVSDITKTIFDALDSVVDKVGERTGDGKKHIQSAIASFLGREMKRDADDYGADGETVRWLTVGAKKGDRVCVCICPPGVKTPIEALQHLEILKDTKDAVRFSTGGGVTEK